MAGDAIVLSWGPVVGGRELKAFEVFEQSIADYSELQQSGRIDSFEPVLLAPHGGGLAGFILIRGSRASLDEIRESGEFRLLTARAAAIVDEVGVIDAYTGEALGQQMATFRSVAEEMSS
jgi:hypothetical protein